jgi:RNA polymerase sigma factor (sigma-70 family)
MTSPSNAHAGPQPITRVPNRALLLAALEHEPILRALLYRYTRNNADVEELLQDLYAKLLTASARQQDNPGGYVFIAARNIARDWLKHRKCVSIDLMSDVEELETLDESALIDEIVSTHQQIQIILEAAKGLSDRRREVFVLRKVYGYSQRQIADRLGIAENTVEAHLVNAARSLARILGSRLP